MIHKLIAHILEAADKSQPEWEDIELSLVRIIARKKQLEATNTKLLEALKEIAKGEGAYSRDPLKHAGNTIVNMRQIAREAIRKAKKQA